MWKRLFSLFTLSVCLACLTLSGHVSAYNYSSTSNFYFANSGDNYSSWMSIYFNPTDGTYTRWATDTQGAATWIWSGSANVPSNGTITNINLKLRNKVIPAHSLFSYSIRYAGLVGSKVTYNGFVPGNNWSLISDSCAQSAQAEPGSAGEVYAGDFTCTYYGVTGDNDVNVINMYGYILNMTTYGLLVLANGGSYVEIEEESGSGGSSGDYDDIIDEIQYVLGEVRNNNSQNTVINNNIVAIRDALAGSSGTEGIVDKLDALIDQAEQQREELEEVQEDAQDTAEDAQDQIDNDTATITEQIGTIIGIIKDTPATNCNINGNMGVVNLGTMNMCQGVPQSIRDVVIYVASGVLVLAILRLAYSLVKVYVGYLQSYTGGE